MDVRQNFPLTASAAVARPAVLAPPRYPYASQDKRRTHRRRARVVVAVVALLCAVPLMLALMPSSDPVQAASGDSVPASGVRAVQGSADVAAQ